MTFFQKVGIFLLLAIFAPGIYFAINVSIFYGLGIIGAIIQFLLLLIEVPINTIMKLVEVLGWLIGQDWDFYIDLNFDEKNTSFFDLTNYDISFPTPGDMSTQSWYTDFLTNGTLDPLKFFLPFYLEWV